MNLIAKAERLVPSLSPANMIISCLPLTETIGTMTDALFLDGPTFLHDKAISCRNSYVAKVQAVTPL